MNRVIFIKNNNVIMSSRPWRRYNHIFNRVIFIKINNSVQIVFHVLQKRYNLVFDQHCHNYRFIYHPHYHIIIFKNFYSAWHSVNSLLIAMINSVTIVVICIGIIKIFKNICFYSPSALSKSLKTFTQRGTLWTPCPPCCSRGKGASFSGPWHCWHYILICVM